MAIIGAVVAVCGFAGGLLPLAAIGLVLVGAGVWNICRPAISGLIVDGVVMILTGLFNGLLWLWIENTRSSSVGSWVIAGLVQIVWGIRRLAIYPTARSAVNDPQAIARLESIVRNLSKADGKTDPSTAEFRTGRFHHHRNRLGLYADGAVALLEGEVVRLEKRSDIWIEAAGTTSLGRSIKVRIQMGDFELTGQMPSAHFERFERWKLGLSQPRSLAA